MKKVINLISGPGGGKSTLACGVFSRLKTLGVKCELVTEYAKEMVYSRRQNEMSNQLYITAKQNKRLDDIFTYDPEILVITDSPLILGFYYGHAAPYAEELKNLILAVNSNYQNINVFVNRQKEYKTYGRNQTEAEAREIDAFLLNELGLNYDYSVDGTQDGILELCEHLKRDKIVTI